nr:hypothetical protein [uncultured Duganella sp.]
MKPYAAALKPYTTAFALSAACLSSGCSSLSVRDVESDPDQVKIGSSYYRLAESAQTAMLQAGNKRDNAFNPLFRAALSGPLDIRFVTAAGIETSSKNAYDAAVSLGVPVVKVTAGVTTDRSSQQTAKLNVINVIDMIDLARELDSPKNSDYIQQLAQFDRPRIVTALVSVEELSSNRSSGMTGKLGADYAVTGNVTLEGSVGGGASAQRVETLSKGTIYAYQLSRICWRNTDGKARIAFVVPDRRGAGNDCPGGTFDSAGAALAGAAAKL